MEIENIKKHNWRGRVLGGLVLIGIGVIILLKQMNLVIFPYWLFTWPVFMIALGLFLGVRRGFCGGSWLMFMLIGGVFLIKDIYPGTPVADYIWPIIIIGAGMFMIFRSRRHSGWERHIYRNRREWVWKDEKNPGLDSPSGEPVNKDDYIDVVSVFGGNQTVVVSKNFKGGDIVNIFGGSDINLTQADFTGAVTLDVTSIFGGAKIMVPTDWKIINKFTSILGGVEDKRPPSLLKENPDKTLIIDGTCIFGGLSIQCY